MHRRVLRTLAAASVLTLALAGCGQSDDSTVTPETNSTDETTDEADDADANEADDGAANDAGDAEANEADVAFVQGMIPHHEGATEMAELVPDRTDRTELNELADQIIASQTDEIDQMQAMLDRMGADPMPMDDMDHMDGEMDAEMGMMSSEDMADLEMADGAEFERRFLEGMVVHHQGAIDMSDEVLSEGSDPEVATLAEDIIAAQEREIEQMSAWLEEWDLA